MYPTLTWVVVAQRHDRGWHGPWHQGTFCNSLECYQHILFCYCNITANCWLTACWTPCADHFATEIYQGVNCALVDPAMLTVTLGWDAAPPSLVPTAVLHPSCIVIRHSSAVSSSMFTCGLTVHFFVCWCLSHETHGWGMWPLSNPSVACVLTLFNVLSDSDYYGKERA